ncbi:TetR/AcrR family transcriptional regulator [Natronoglycomyces albus]|uniref:TetR/AcrR family transcriptional regulator n=1 Tax=Natronoglycomyces albus TaxID=2811108 RepID=A0A895XTA8_9ACTN|nr:TetR/AcrR family transcriptional regulator [Natronoglycomyces albus]QSB06723.1 TetR/AcrR family transcriptional regulator [Natronoglycomyces albus]
MARENSKSLRADAQRSAIAILEAAERVLSIDSAATLERIAEAAGVSRTTIHRRYSNRDALLASLAQNAHQLLTEAIASARPQSAPPLVALHQATANILIVKAKWPYSLGLDLSPDLREQVHEHVYRPCETVFRRAQETGHIRANVDLTWARLVYFALLKAAVVTHLDTHDSDATGQEGTFDAATADQTAALIIDTLFTGIGPT